MKFKALRCLRFEVTSGPGYSPQERTLVAGNVNCKPVVAATEFIIPFFRSRRACPTLAGSQFVWKSIRCVAPSNARLFASINFGGARHKPVKSGSVAMNLNPVDTYCSTACIHDGYQYKRTIMDRHTILNGPVSENLGGQFGRLSPQLCIRQCRAYNGGDCAQRPPKFSTQDKPSNKETTDVFAYSGVVLNFWLMKGTGAGSTLQETPNITFSGSDA